ncbi:MFS transporter [Hazenella coriacea]|uniref:Putative MFS family arabinose efflux permease n=1 Tax=Hazenella coriacea TaxID=1179467 RepID=A0A4V2UUQ7_9BACL|nr:MFS transporter [Hazenella coriacea]TCS92538.1 putative MFS family arabinose efflux permease [Hazenella coriacea]
MKKVLLLTLGMFALGFDAYVVAGLLPEISATFSISHSQAGQVVSVFTLCFALVAPIFATLIARKSMRNILVIALAVFSIANAASALAPNFSLLLIARAVAGAGAGLFSPLATVAAASLVSEQKRGRALGMTLGGMSMGTVIGVPLGLITAEQVGWQGTLWLVTIVGFIPIIGIIVSFPNTLAKAPPSLRQRFTMMTNKKVLAIVSITFIAAIASLGLYTYISSLLQNVGDINNVTPYLWAWGIGGVVGSFSIGTLIDRLGRPALLLSGILAVLALAMFSLPFALKFPMLLYLPIFLWGTMGWASLAPQQHALLLAQPDHSEAVVALNSSANYLGGAVGSMVGGFILLSGLSPSQLPVVTGLLVLVAFLGQLVIMFTNKTKSQTD